MSCTQIKTGNTDPQFNCDCDGFSFPPPLNIGAGLNNIPRQLATFPEFRRAMLFALRSKTPLAYWKARKPGDPGLMLLEMWAYVCDSLSFYDEVIASEEYLRTARLRPSLRKLVALLGYLPRPAVGATLRLATFAEGRQPVKLPLGTAFRSRAFDQNPPQVFELDEDTVIHPMANSWTIQSPHPGKVLSNQPSELLIAPRAEIKPDALVMLISGTNGMNQANIVSEVGPYTGFDGNLYTKVAFQSATKLPAGTQLSSLRLMTPTQSTSLWTLYSSPVSIESENANHSILTLSRLHREIKTGDYIVLERNKELRWFSVTQVAEVMRLQSPQVQVPATGTAVYYLPGISFPVTQLTLDTFLNDGSRHSGLDWSSSNQNEIVVHYGMILAGLVIDEAKTTLSATDAPFTLQGNIETPFGGYDPRSFQLVDKNDVAVGADGQVDFNTRKLTLLQGENWQPDLTLPVTVFGNSIMASRGERVVGEILGSGDASVFNQSFKLRKKPLTYLFSPTAGNDAGVQNTLRVYVNGVLWTEAPSFYNKTARDQVYIVRQNDDGDSFVTFGDGVRGECPSTGKDNIIAYYRFGAGKAAPPAGAVTQIAKPVQGLQSVRNPMPASGGDDAEPAAQIRGNAPKTALILGRVVSIQDMEAVAFSLPGVRAVQAEWRWNSEKLRPAAHIWYIGETGIEKTLTQRLRNLSDPTTSYQVQKATPIPAALTLDILVDPAYMVDQVISGIRQTLTNTQTGLLAPENLGIGRPLFRSKIFAEVLSVAGAVAVRSIHWNGQSFSSFAQKPGAGKYFDFEHGTLELNGKTN
jgi:hypothetical protein